MTGLRIGVDIGGTFTDFVVADDRTGQLYNEKMLTTPDDPSAAVLAGIKRLIDAHNLSPAEIETVIHGTTLVANALIERKGVRTALITTSGFRDLLEIRREWRYDAYDLLIEPPQPLVQRSLRFEVVERMNTSGTVVTPFDDASAETVARALAVTDVEAVAVCFLHAFRNGEHERRMRDILAKFAPNLTVCLSHEVMPEIGEYERSSTTVANAYVLPIFRAYVRRLAEGLRGLGIHRDLHLTLSDGGTVHVDTAIELPIRLVQSGPAGGVQATTLIGRLAGEANLLCFDMGGTTAKACFVENGRPVRTTDFEVARMARFKRGSGLPVRVPVVDMIEIGAGGGSIARVNSMGLIEVGPDSASSKPGPACYGLGGTDSTVTDCDLLLGYLAAASFLGGDMRLDEKAAKAAVEANLGKALSLAAVESAHGVFETVNENMAQAASIHALEQGKRIADFALVAIGGAGPVHAWAMARKLGIRRVICPLGAGVASALGFLAAPMSFEFVQGWFARMDAFDGAGALALVKDLEARGRTLLSGAGLGTADLTTRVACAMRYVGQGHEIEISVPFALIEAGRGEELAARFAAEYNALYGRTEHVPVEMTSWRVAVSGPVPEVVPRRPTGIGEGGTAKRGERPVHFADLGGFVTTPVFDRYALAPGWKVAGPAIVEERESTVVVPPRSTARIDEHLNLVLELHD